MIKNERQLQILELLKNKNYMSVEDIAGEVNYSIPTIRRDLLKLTEQGYIIRKRGGAILKDNSLLTPLDYRSLLNTNQKKAICQEASKFINDYMTIFLDDSTTVTSLIPYLKKYEHLIIITNGFSNCVELNKNNIPYYCTGGKIIDGVCYAGVLALNFINNFSADLCFFSTTSILKNGVIADVGENEAYLKQAMIKHSKKSIYLCDRSKLEKHASFNVTNSYEVYKIITTLDENVFEFDKDKIIHVDSIND